MTTLTGRLKREYDTLVCMAVIYCEDHHGQDGKQLCTECADLMRYAETRLEKCLYGQQKPTCAKCPIHCYKRQQREQVREVMRYAGPKMPLRHPVRSLMHTLDKLRRVVQPREWRRRHKKQP